MVSIFKRARQRAGITIQQIHEESGVSRPTIMKADRGIENITYENAARIVIALNELANEDYTVESLQIKTSN